MERLFLPDCTEHNKFIYFSYKIPKEYQKQIKQQPIPSAIPELTNHYILKSKAHLH